MTPDAPAPRVRSRRWPWLLGWLLLVIHFVTPPREAADHSLDHSNYATYFRFFAERAQWGEEVLPMTGPYGFILYGHTYTGELFWLRFAGDLLLKAVFSALLLHLFLRAGPGGWRWAWVAGVAVLVPLVDDLFHDFAILTATLCLLVNLGPRLGFWSALSVGTLGFLALFKGTHFLTASLCFGGVLLQALASRRFRPALVLTGTYAGVLVGFWCLAGQNPANFPGYLRAVLELSSGYNATMGLAEPSLFFATGLALAALLAGLFGWGAARAGRALPGAIALLLLAGFTFIKWKHGFLRADGHVAIFFASAGVIALTIALVVETRLLGPAAPSAAPAGLRRTGLGAVTLAAGLSLLATLEYNLELAGHVLLELPGRLQRHARYLAAPGKLRAEYAEDLAHHRREAHVPQIQNEIGAERVDFFGYEQGLLLLNGFNYHPRPMGGGSFNVFTPWLQEQNEAFVRNPRRAPPWYVFRLQTLDGRLPAGDDPLTLRALLHGYSPVLMQRDYLLLRRRTRPEFPETTLLETRAVRPGEAFTPPDPGPGRMLLFTIEAPLTLGGRIRSFLYRPPALRLRLAHERLALGRDFAIWPVMFQRPVILSPLLLENRDVIDLYGEDPGNRPDTLALHPEAGYRTDALRVSFFTAPRPAAPETGDIAELKTYIEHPLHNRPPTRIDAPPTGILELNKEPITSLHAPGSATWELQPQDQQFIFSYGMMPRTYLEGDTDGVIVSVEVTWPSGDGRVLFSHTLRPRTVPEDQGMQRTRLFLPPYEPGARLRVSVHPGQDNNANYDQAYITRVQLKPGPLVAGQFNGLGVVPASRRLPASAVAGIGNRPVYLIHAPDEVVLDLPPGAREFSAEIGLLPGAYQDGGNSDGVDYTLTALLPDGSSRTLASRFLNPVGVGSDRGPQTWQVDLPLLPAGTRLRLATGVGPAGNRGWDQSYVAQVSFR